MHCHFRHKDIVSMRDLNREEVLFLLDEALRMKERGATRSLTGKILASCFFEPSTRTRLSFESAMLRLGGQVIGFSEGTTSSVQKGESLADSIRIIGGYADAIVIRHPLEGAARVAAEATERPVINAGDGTNQHPTQTLLDLFTIRECQGRLDGISLAMVGDLKHGRTVHSLAQACAHFDMRLYFVAPEALEMPTTICDDLREKGVCFSFHRTIEEIIDRVDILYMTRIQKERFEALELYHQLKSHYELKVEMLQTAQPHLKVLHPLPRVSEIDSAIDQTPNAYYFQQAQNGVYVRQALLNLVLGGEDGK
jgi:aspartate carbamoyltransferase catalytic subunit